MIFNMAQSPALQAALAALHPTAHLSSQLSRQPSKRELIHHSMIFPHQKKAK